MKDEEAIELYRLAKDVCKKQNIVYDEDIIQELVLHALTKADHYDESKSKWSTFIFNCMKNKLKDLFKPKNTKKRNCNQVDFSLDYVIEDHLSYHEIVPSKINVSEEYTDKEFYQRVEHLIDLPLKLYLKGFTQNEIAKKMNCSQTKVCYTIKNNIELIRKYCVDNDLYNFYKS